MLSTDLRPRRPGSLTKGGGMNERDTREPDAGARFSRDGGPGQSEPCSAKTGLHHGDTGHGSPAGPQPSPAPRPRQYQQITEWSCKSGAAGRCGRGTMAAVFKSWNTVQRYRRLMAAMLRCGR